MTDEMFKRIVKCGGCGAEVTLCITGDTKLDDGIDPEEALDEIAKSVWLCQRCQELADTPYIR